MTQVAGKENKKYNKDFEILNYQLHYKGMCLRDPWTSPADPPYFHGTRLEYQWIYVMATQWFGCALLNSVAWRLEI